jgi:predicted amidohydrolase
VTTSIACGQFTAAPGDMGRNISLMTEMAHEAALKGASLIVFPEMSLSGYLPAEEVKAAAVSPEGAEVAGMLAAAHEAGIWILFGFAEARGGGKISNSMACADTRGRLIGIYRKVHLFTGEEKWAEPGDGFIAIDTGFARIAPLLCYDGRFPEAARAVSSAGAVLALTGAAWLGPAEEWELAMRARALDNGMYAAGAALQGSYAGNWFHGESLISDPHGRVIARAREGREMVIIGDFDTDIVASFRARLPLLRHLRPEAYKTEMIDGKSGGDPDNGDAPDEPGDGVS